MRRKESERQRKHDGKQSSWGSVIRERALRLGEIRCNSWLSHGNKGQDKGDKQSSMNEWEGGLEL